MTANKTIALFALAFLSAAACGGQGAEADPTPEPDADVPTPTTYVETDFLGVQAPIAAIAYIHHADGSYADSIPFDEDGRAAIEDLLPRGAITVAIQSESSRLLVTTTEVIAGETLRIVDESYFLDDTVSVRFDWDPAEVPEASTFRVRYSCRTRILSEGSDAELDVYPACPEGTSFAVLIARDDDREPIAYAMVETGAPVEGMVIDFLDADWRSDFEELDITITNSSLPGSLYLETAALRDGTTVSEFSDYLDVDPGGTALVHQKLFGQPDTLLASIYTPVGNGVNSATIPVDLSSASAIELDLGKEVLPAIESATFFAPGTFQAELAGPARCPAGGDVDIGVWVVEQNPGMGENITWVIAAPGAATELTLPSIGPDAPEWSFADGAAPYVSLYLLADPLRGYDALQRDWIGPVFDDNSTAGCKARSGGV